MEKLKKLAEQAKQLPNAVIEYSCELPEDCKPDNIYGVRAVFNKNVSKSAGAVLTYKF